MPKAAAEVGLGGGSRSGGAKVRFGREFASHWRRKRRNLASLSGLRLSEAGELKFCSNFWWKFFQGGGSGDDGGSGS